MAKNATAPAKEGSRIDRASDLLRRQRPIGLTRRGVIKDRNDVTHAVTYRSHARALSRDHGPALGRVDGAEQVEAVVNGFLMR